MSDRKLFHSAFQKFIVELFLFSKYYLKKNLYEW